MSSPAPQYAVVISALQPGIKFSLQMDIFRKQDPKVADYWLGDLEILSWCPIFCMCVWLVPASPSCAQALTESRSGQSSASPWDSGGGREGPAERRVCVPLPSRSSEWSEGACISPSGFMVLEQLLAQHILSLNSRFQVTENFQRTENELAWDCGRGEYPAR